MQGQQNLFEAGGTGNSVARNFRDKIIALSDRPKNWYISIFWVADYKSQIRFLKFEMAVARDGQLYSKSDRIDVKIGAYSVFGSLITKPQLDFYNSYWRMAGVGNFFKK